MVNEYRIIRSLGQGSYGVVKLCEKVSSHGTPLLFVSVAIGEQILTAI